MPIGSILRYLFPPIQKWRMPHILHTGARHYYGPGKRKPGRVKRATPAQRYHLKR